MMNDDRYTSGLAVEQAIKTAAKREHQQHPERNIADIIRQMHYDRFLCRVFSEDEQSEWVLKGGSAMLARIPTTRRTLGADLFKQGYDLDQSLEDLKRLASKDLHDFFAFTFESITPIVQGDNQPYLDGYRVVFRMSLGTKELGNIHVDLVTHQGALRSVEVVSPRNLPILSKKLESHRYRLYPIANQIADKACAVVERINGRESTRIKDLVDLAIIANTQDCSASELMEALRGECRRRRLSFPFIFHIPGSWKTSQFRKTAAGTPVQSYELQDAEELVARFLDVPIPEELYSTRWNHADLKWETSIE
ncbi:nucleotidyl transferase AbiEii/AbiGii toxin family protein [Bifidobacterium amazonense]|uniref:Nucleotidyl transferase AbiEii/AbiGii toxin family protein n=1 Tax=Bifidobacterium amazonense TaxID=2809027 RepID=A0ABS9VUJ9_9BIFI|nr:nucleotidyl transferase AbiEii/AbiGii toxin family protein [Bifidobacterium amazonense]MCH9275629.1 nucleotidyl transferase AbiEii/AbiGii toxin family protein [Bifidobacterium amazonense]